MQVVVSQAAGTAIGNATANGGLAAAYDGNTNQSEAASAMAEPASPTAGAYCGKDWGSGVTKTITGFVVTGSNDQGFQGFGVTGGTITAELEGSTDNFSSSIVGLGSASITDANSAVISKLTGITTTTAYRYHRIKLTSNLGSGSQRFDFAEVVFYENI